MNWSAQTDGNWVYVEPGWVEQLQAAPVYADAGVQQAFMEMVARIDRLPADEEAFARFLYLPSQLLAPAVLDLYAYPSKGDEAQALTELITVGEGQQGPVKAEEHILASGKVVYRSLGAFSDGDDVGHHSLRLTGFYAWRQHGNDLCARVLFTSSAQVAEVMAALEALVDNLELEVSELEAAQSMFAAFPSQLG